MPINDELPNDLIDAMKKGVIGPTGINIVWETGSKNYHEFNDLLNAEDWYPFGRDIFWFGDDGVGTCNGYNIKDRSFLRWNSEDGLDLVGKFGSLDELVKSITSEWEAYEND